MFSKKFSKRKTKASKGTYKTSKNLFEKVLNNSKKHEHQNRLLKDKNDVKKTWSIMKEVTGKIKVNCSCPNKLIVINTDIT